MKSLLMPREVDRLLRYPRGRAARLARIGQIPHIVLPDGEIRFDETDIEKLLISRNRSEQREGELAHA